MADQPAEEDRTTTPSADGPAVAHDEEPAATTAEAELSRGEALVDGGRAMLPLLLGVVPFGLVLGITAVEAGLSVTQVLGMSLLVFAGAAQLVMVELLGAGAGLAVVVATALIVNLRYLMYSASIAPRFRAYAGRWKVVLSYLVTDQSYAVAMARFERSDGEPSAQPWYFVGAALTIWGPWQVATVAGATVGASARSIPSLSFAVPLTFTALLVPTVTDSPRLVAALVGGGVAVAAAGLPNQLGLLAGAIAGVAAGVLAQRATGAAPPEGGGGGDDAGGEPA